MQCVLICHSFNEWRVRRGAVVNQQEGTMKRINLAIIVLLMMIIQSCADVNTPTVNETSNEIIPLAVGNTWNYHTTLYDTTGNVFMDFNNSNKIVGDTTIQNINWFYYDKNALYFSIFQDGFHIYDPYKTDSLRDQLNFKYPCSVGDKYSYYEVVKIDTQITVPAGTFSCIMYSLRMQTSMDFAFIDFFIKPGVGNIKTIEYSYTENYPLFTYRISELLGASLY